MRIVCAWCGKDIGEKEPLADKSITHGICEECLIKHFPLIAEKVKEGGGEMAGKERRLGEPRTNIERITSHYGVSESEARAHPEKYPLPERGTGFEAGTASGLSDEEVNRIAEAVVEKAREDVGIDALMLHSVPYLHGSPGIVVNEVRAKATPCKCVEYKPGKKLCWSPGIIGALTDEQEASYCPTTLAIERPGTVSRMEKWQEAVDICKAEIAPIPEEKGEERMTTWMRCMSRELKARGIET